MTNPPDDENDRTIYQPKTGTKPAKPNLAEAEPPAVAPAMAEEGGGVADPAHEATRFEKPPASAPLQSPAPPPNAPQPNAPIPPAGRRRQFEDGEVLNGIYRIQRFLARGGMGEVYEASNIHQQQERVAIKVMLPHLAQDELVAAMFSQEAEMLTRLHHEAIVPYRMAARDAQGNPYIVTEFVDGPSLEQKLGKLELSEQEFAYLAQKLAAGLGTAHNLGAVHRDIAPDNILLAGGDPARPKIIDFGIAKDARENSGTIVGDGFAGKLKYVAPEQLGEYGRNIGPWTDLYSLALTLRAVAAGVHSDMGGSLADAVRKRQGVPDLAAVPERFRPAFEMALQPDPAQRPQSMAEFILRLGEPFGEGTGLSIGQGTAFGALAQPPASAPTARDKRREKPKSEGPSPFAKVTAGVSSAMSGLAGNRLALIGGGIAALLLVVVTVVVVLNSGGAAGDAGGSGSEQVAGADASGGAQASGGGGGGSSDAMALDTPEFAALAKRAIGGAECAWLSYDGAGGGLARFVGGAANPAAAQTALVDALKEGATGAPSIDMGDVVRFKPENCAAVDALLAARSTVPLIASPQTNYEVEKQEVANSEGAIIAAEGEFAKVEVRISNLKPSDEVALISMDTFGGFEVIARNRAQVTQFVEALKGNASGQNIAMTIPYSFDGPQKESHAILIVTSPSPLPETVIGAGFGQGSGWAESFRSAAKQNGWKVDAIWFSVENKVR